MASPSAVALDAQPIPAPLQKSPILITGYQVTGNRPAFIQLFNNSSSMVSLNGWEVEYVTIGADGEVEVPIALNGWLLPEQYLVISDDGSVGGADLQFTSLELPSDFLVKRIRLAPPSTYESTVINSPLSGGIRYELSKSGAGNYTSTSKMIQVGVEVPLYAGGLYMHPQEASFSVWEIYPTKRDCMPLEDTPGCYEYIKIYNQGTEPVDLSQYRLRFGVGNEASGIANTVHLTGVLGSSEYRSIRVRDDSKQLDIPSGGGSVWIEDKHGLKIYEPSIRTYGEIGEGVSWAVDEVGVWRQGTPSPHGVNIFDIHSSTPGSGAVSGLTPCRDDQYRNPETNRCRLVATSSDAKACDEGEYRNPETNRCRSATTSSSTLKECLPYQYRSPDTNRCRNVETAAAELTPCKEGQERNPATNRCRKIGTSPSGTDHAPEIAGDVGGGFAGWWALGGVGSIALGRLGWEWREEIGNLIKKAGSFFTSSK